TVSNVFGAGPPPPTADVADYSQCSNDLGTGYTSGDTGCRWINGNLQSNNSIYFEGDATPQRAFIKQLTNGSHTIAFQYDVMKNQSGTPKHAYDFLTDYNFSENWITQTDLCDIANTNGFGTVANCSGAAISATNGTVPPNSICGSTGASGSFRIINGAISSVDAPTIASGDCSGDTDAKVTVHFSVNTTTCVNKTVVQGTDTCAVLIAFGAHVSKQSDYGAGTTAISISGSPYHVALSNLDGGAIGQKDNQMQAGAVVVPDSTSLVTAIHNGSNHNTDVQSTTVAAGSTIHDRATVTNTGNGGKGTPAGTVTFQFFSNGTCTNTPTATSAALALSNGVVDATSFSQGPLAPGSYSFLASYTPSDVTKWTNSTGACESVTVGKASSTTVTAIHNGSNHNTDVQSTTVALGSTIHDQATVSGSYGTPTGTATFQYWTNGTCDSTEADTSAALALSSGVVDATSFTKGPLAAGDYSFKAAYSGDSTYNNSVGTCESVTVGKAGTSVTTEVHNASHQDITNTSVALGTAVHDSATVNGQVGNLSISGNVTYHFYTNDNCDGTSTDETVAVGTEASTKNSLGAGAYSYKAEYGGDDNYNSSVGTCEPFNVSQATPTVVTEIHDDSEAIVTSVDAGITVHDKATVSGINGFDPTGDVDFTFYNNGSCEGEGVASGTGTALVSGAAHPSDSQGPLNAGPYSFQAHYNGDENYSAKDADCEPLTVNLLSPDISTTPDPIDGNVGVVLSDSANLTGGFNLTGSITFNLYDPSDPTCTGAPVHTDTVSVSGAGVYNTSAGFASNTGGTWRWVAIYSGDGNNNPVADNCDDEQMTISALPVVLGENTGGQGEDPGPQVLAASLTNTGTSVWATTLVGGTLLTSTLALFAYSRFARRQN
ncbi:Ig-like domain repeat protein, partial [Candidatus Saccharibacteria bacterium]|nr:Ig-like domain repeat protein [Candidatus Saccharibacteria bacterium]